MPRTRVYGPRSRKNVRLPDELAVWAQDYADRNDLSFNRVVEKALAAYRAARDPSPGDRGWPETRN